MKKIDYNETCFTSGDMCFMFVVVVVVVVLGSLGE